MLFCIRADGTRLETELYENSAYHDLAHYAVETHLGLKEGFWGRIEEGFSLEEYALPNESRPFQISAEGYKAEFLATLVQSAVPSGQISPAFVQMLRQSSLESGIPFPELPAQASLDSIIAEAQRLSNAWQMLQEGERLYLEFPLTGLVGE